MRLAEVVGDTPPSLVLKLEQDDASHQPYGLKRSPPEVKKYSLKSYRQSTIFATTEARVKLS